MAIRRQVTHRSEKLAWQLCQHAVQVIRERTAKEGLRNVSKPVVVFDDEGRSSILVDTRTDWRGLLREYRQHKLYSEPLALRLLDALKKENVFSFTRPLAELVQEYGGAMLEKPVEVITQYLESLGPSMSLDLKSFQQVYRRHYQCWDSQ